MLKFCKKKNNQHKTKQNPNKHCIPTWSKHTPKAHPPPYNINIKTAYITYENIVDKFMWHAVLNLK